MEKPANASSEWEFRDIFALNEVEPCAFHVRDRVSEGCLAVVRWNSLDVYHLNDAAKPWKKYEIKGTKVYGIWFDPTGRLLAAGLANTDHVNYGMVYNLNDDQQVEFFDDVSTSQYLGSDLGSRAGAYTLSGSMLAAASNAVNYIHVFDPHPFHNQGKNTPLIGTLFPREEYFKTKALVWSRDERFLAHVGSWYKLGSALGVSMMGQVQEGVQLWAVEWNSQNQREFRWLGEVRLPLETNDEWGGLSDKKYTLGAVFTPDSRYLMIGSDAAKPNTIRVLDLISKKVVWESERQKTIIHCLALSPNGRYLFSGGKDGCLKIWRVAEPDQKMEMVLVKTVAVTGEIIGFHVVPEDAAAVVLYKTRKTTCVGVVRLPASIELGLREDLKLAPLPANEPALDMEPVLASGHPFPQPAPQAAAQVLAPNQPAASPVAETLPEPLPPAAGKPVTGPERKKSGGACLPVVLMTVGVLLLLAGAFFGFGMILTATSTDPSTMVAAKDNILFGSVCVAPALLVGVVSTGIGIYLLARKKKAG